MNQDSSRSEPSLETALKAGLISKSYILILTPSLIIVIEPLATIEALVFVALRILFNIKGPDGIVCGLIHPVSFIYIRIQVGVTVTFDCILICPSRFEDEVLCLTLA